MKGNPEYTCMEGVDEEDAGGWCYVNCRIVSRNDVGGPACSDCQRDPTREYCVSYEACRRDGIIDEFIRQC